MGPTPELPDPKPEEGWVLLLFAHEIKGKDGTDGLDGHEGPQGLPGPPGRDGTGTAIQGVLHSVNDLLAVTEGVHLGVCYLIETTNDVWILKELPSTVLNSWKNLGKITGARGPAGRDGYNGARGKQGPQGPRGPKGASGGISNFLLNWITSTVTNQVLTAAQIGVNDMINDALLEAENTLQDAVQSAAQEAIDEVIDEALEDLKGEKGEKGDDGEKGKDGKDGKSVQLVGSYEYLTQFQLEYPANEGNVGKAALIGRDGSKKLMWAIIARPAIAGIVTYTYDEIGDITGPQGEPGKDAEWSVSIRDAHFVEKNTIEVATDLEDGVPGMYIQESDSILVLPPSGSAEAPTQVGFQLKMKYPIPELVPEKPSRLGETTKGKVLSNDGEKLTWVDGGAGGTDNEALYLKSPSGTIFEITIGDDGRLDIDHSVGDEGKDFLSINSQNGKTFMIRVGNDGRLNITEK